MMTKTRGDGRAPGGPKGPPGLAAFLLAAAVVLGALGGAALGASSVRAQERLTFDMAPAEHPNAGIGVRLVDVPADRRDDPRANRYIIDHVAPGAVVERRMQVSNGTADAVSVSLYPAAAQLTDGNFMPDPGREQNELASWMTVTPGTVQLPPGGSTEALLRVAVPRDARAGERYAVALAELPPAPATGALDVVVRAGIRVYLSVGPGAEPRVDFGIDTITARRDNGQRPLVEATVRNSGERAIDVAGQLTLVEGPGHLSAGPFPVTSLVSIGPGEQSAVGVVLDEAVPDGPWTAVMTLRSGTLQRQVSAVVTFPRAGERGITVSAAPVGGGPPLPLVLLSALLVILTAAGLAFVRWDDRRARAPLRSV